MLPTNLPECPDEFTREFAKELLGALGADISKIGPDDCWIDLGRKFAKYRSQVEEYFAKATTGKPAYAAYAMTRYCRSSRHWAKRVIENAKTGDPALVAAWMALECGVSREWAERVIENATIGDPGGAAFLMTRLRDDSSSCKWAKIIIERAETGDPSYAAYRMVMDRRASRKWAEGVIERATCGNPPCAAQHMLFDCGSSLEWTKRVIENAKCGDPPFFAYIIVYARNIPRTPEEISHDREWAEKLIEEKAAEFPFNAFYAADKMVRNCGSSTAFLDRVLKIYNEVDDDPEDE